MRFTDTSLGVGDTKTISVRLDTLDIFRCFGSILESEFEWRNVPGTTYNINIKCFKLLLILEYIIFQKLI